MHKLLYNDKGDNEKKKEKGHLRKVLLNQPMKAEMLKTMRMRYLQRREALVMLTMSMKYDGIAKFTARNRK